MISYQAFPVSGGDIPCVFIRLRAIQHDHLLHCEFNPCQLRDGVNQAYLTMFCTAAVHAVQARKNLQLSASTPGGLCSPRSTGHSSFCLPAALASNSGPGMFFSIVRLCFPPLLSWMGQGLVHIFCPWCDHGSAISILPCSTSDHYA